MNGDRSDRFTERARRVLTHAQEEAARFNHNYIGTEHLLLGLTRESDGVAARVLRSLGVELHRVRSAVEFIIGRGDRAIVGEIGLTPRSKKVIELAVDEAHRLGHHYIGTEHLLLGLVREGQGIAAGVLESLGVGMEKVRARTIQVLFESGQAVATESAPLGAAEQDMRLAWGPEAAMPPRRKRWEYLIVRVAYPEPGGEGIVERVYGEGADRFVRGATPIHQALQALGAEGWELAAMDSAGVTNARYILKRPLYRAPSL